MEHEFEYAYTFITGLCLTNPTGAMAALYVACLAGNVTEHLWNFTWPAALATLHPSLLPVAAIGFFSKVSLCCYDCSAC